ncbi:hypothetical protein F5Y11DRAFT_318105 [Daldinia sp. FL1419]|nr:hypothetical protein F5Y11DRAFT_318105 [Daldinia sp. FL1419]
MYLVSCGGGIRVVGPPLLYPSSYNFPFFIFFIIIINPILFPNTLYNITVIHLPRSHHSSRQVVAPDKPFTFIARPPLRSATSSKLSSLITPRLGANKCNSRLSVRALHYLYHAKGIPFDPKNLSAFIYASVFDPSPYQSQLITIDLPPYNPYLLEPCPSVQADLIR